MLRTSICTIFTANALVRVNLGNSVYNLDGIVAAYCCTCTLSKTPCSAESQSLRVKLCGLLTGLNAHFFIFLRCSSVAGAFYESDIALERSKIMKSIYDDFLFAFYHAGNAADALVVVDNGVVVHDGYCAFRTCSFTFSAGDAAVAAGLSYDFVILFC